VVDFLPLLTMLIQLVLNYSQLFLSHCAQRSLLGHVLAHQTVDVFLSAPMPSTLGIGKVTSLTQSLVNLFKLREFFSFVQVQHLHLFSLFNHAELAGIAEVHWAGDVVVCVQLSHITFDQLIRIAERSVWVPSR
jgi:hypothetical protein